MRNGRMHQKRVSDTRAEILFEDAENLHWIRSCHHSLMQLLPAPAPKRTQSDMMVGEIRHGDSQYCPRGARAKCHADDRAAWFRACYVVVPLWTMQQGVGPLDRPRGRGVWQAGNRCVVQCKDQVHPAGRQHVFTIILRSVAPRPPKTPDVSIKRCHRAVTKEIHGLDDCRTVRVVGPEVAWRA
jgi:hypothetical protein